MSMFHQAGTNYGHRRFQSTGFGLERDVSGGDSLPVWKKQMFNNIRNNSKKHRNELLQRLRQQRNNANHDKLSPNSKRQNAHSTIDSFKKTIIEQEMKQQFRNLNMQKTNNNNNNTHNNNGNNGKSNIFQQDIDFAHFADEEYKQIFDELQRYLEETELKDFRASVINSIDEEKQIDENIELQQEIEQFKNNQYTVICPVCCKESMAVECMNNNQRIYSCFCGLKFQPRDNNVSNNNNKNNMNMDELNENNGHEMLKTLKNALMSLNEYHSKQLQCPHQLNFAVTQQTGYLQAWCCQCKCNEIVI